MTMPTITASPLPTRIPGADAPTSTACRPALVSMSGTRAAIVDEPHLELAFDDTTGAYALRVIETA